MLGTREEPEAEPAPKARPKHELLTRILRERGWRQADLARAAGVGDNTISQLMLLKFGFVSDRQIVAVADACGVHPLELVPLELRHSRPGKPSPPGNEVEVPFSVLRAAGEHIPEPARLPDEQDSTKLAVQELHAALRRGGLRDRDALVVYGHYGLGRNPTPLTLEQLASRLECSRERVRQRLRRALDRLRLVIECMRGQDPRPPKPWPERHRPQE